ncbi:hypothetical protein EYF80_025146 [Liparis tanakae]|uniref:Uncharacterized protein n=1 Tax=Liparis tanakae TaxID=230148 RepID=A0A4Z2HFI5_9TELE|nr:hypothetical protein EYF80_025146 [Liparis tanakae]
MSFSQKLKPGLGFSCSRQGCEVTGKKKKKGTREGIEKRRRSKSSREATSLVALPARWAASVFHFERFKGAFGENMSPVLVSLSPCLPPRVKDAGVPDGQQPGGQEVSAHLAVPLVGPAPRGGDESFQRRNTERKRPRCSTVEAGVDEGPDALGLHLGVLRGHGGQVQRAGGRVGLPGPDGAEERCY